MNSRELQYIPQKRSRTHSYFFLNGIRYNFNTQIGKGAYGIVSFFKPCENGADYVAVKKPIDPGAVKDLIKEAKAWNVIYPKKSLWVNEDEKRLIMPRFPGEQVDSVAKSLNYTAKLALLIAIAAELHKTFHLRGFVHGDIKANNILADKNQIFFIDLGFVYQIGEQKLGFSAHINDVSTYLAPERLQQDIIGDASQDVYSFGIMCECLGVTGINEIEEATHMDPDLRPTLPVIIEALTAELRFNFPKPF